MRKILLVGVIMLAGCGEPQARDADKGVEVAQATSSGASTERRTFFPLASPAAASVRACRDAALAFDSNRRLEMAEKVVAACEADADAGKGGRDCTFYAVRVSSAASKFVDQMKMIQSGNPGWQGMAAQIRDHNERAKEFAARCSS